MFNLLFLFLSIEIFFFILLLFFFCLLFLNLSVNKYSINLVQFRNSYFYYISLLIILLTTIPSFEFSIFYGVYGSDYLAFFLKVFILISSLFVAVFFSDYCWQYRIYFSEIYIFIVVLLLSFSILLSTWDLLLFYLILELQSLITYVLVMLRRFNSFSVEAGLKYFVLSALASGFIVFGISLIYGLTGLTNLIELKILLPVTSLGNNFALFIAFSFLFVGLLFKIGVSPFHHWIADVYDGVSLPVVLVMSTIMKFPLFVFLIKLYYLFFSTNLFIFWSTLMFFCGVLSMLVGSFYSLNQDKIKRMYAYNVVATNGYLLVVLSFGNLEAFVAVFNYLLGSFLITFFLFSSMYLFMDKFDYTEIVFISQLKWLLNYNFFFALMFSLVFFSFSNIPPLAGFFFKFPLLVVVVKETWGLVFFVMLLASLIAIFINLNFIKTLLFDDRKNYNFLSLELTGSGILGALNVISFLFIFVFIVLSNELFLFFYEFVLLKSFF